MAAGLAGTLTTVLSQSGPPADPCPVGTDQFLHLLLSAIQSWGDSYETPLKRNGARDYMEELHLYRGPYPTWADMGDKPLH